MDKLEMIKFLMEDTIKQLEANEKYDKALAKARKKADEEQKHQNKFISSWDYMPRDLQGRNNQRIKDNLKMIRRLSLDIEKEL
jgi:hypothetical protein